MNNEKLRIYVDKLIKIQVETTFRFLEENMEDETNITDIMDLVSSVYVSSMISCLKILAHDSKILLDAVDRRKEKIMSSFADECTIEEFKLSKDN